MCVVNDSNARRRHRAAYLAPARARPEIIHHANDMIDHDADNIDLTFAMDIRFGQDLQQHGHHVEVPYEASSDFEENSFCRIIHTVYISFVDCLLLSMAMIMSFFLYNVEIITVEKPTASSSSSFHHADEVLMSLPARLGIRPGHDVFGTAPGSHRLWQQRANDGDRDSQHHQQQSQHMDVTTVEMSSHQQPISPPVSVSTVTSRTTRTTTRRGFYESIV